MFYSSVDTTDNLNLLQPVNPWFGSAPWQMYTEYYQWSDGYNSNSEAQNTNPGIFTSLIYLFFHFFFILLY